MKTAGRVTAYGRTDMWRERNDIDNTGRFIMFSGITRIYYRKTVGYVFK
jgi:hypothetical protein